MTENKEKIIDLIYQELENDSLILPTLPNVANEIRSAFNNQPNFSAQSIATIIKSDPALSARLIQVSNSSLYSRSERQQSSIDEAIVILGNVNTVKLITTFAVKQAFAPSSPSLEKHFKNILEQTLSIAAICRGMTLFAPSLDPEEAMLAGLVFQIGKLPVLKFYGDSKINLPEDELEQILTETHAHIGQIILQKWGFPDDVVKVPIEYLNFTKQSSTDISYSDIVTVAYLQNCAGSFHPHSNIDWSTVPAFEKLGLTSDSYDPSDEVTQEIEAALAALS